MGIGGRFGYFLFFFCSGEGEGGVRGARRGGGIGFLIANPTRGGGRFPGGGGAGRVSAANWGIWGGGGLNIFFRARNVHQGNCIEKKNQKSRMTSDYLSVDGVRQLSSLKSLVALYRTMRLRIGYRFESCDANGPRNVNNTNPAKHRPVFFPHFSLLAVRNWS